MSLLVASGGVGNAAPATDTAPSDDERINYLIAAYGIAESEAEQRVTWQGEARRLAKELTSRYPDSLAGVWIDHADGGRLKIATVGDSTPLVEHLRSKSTQPTNIVGLNNFFYTLERLNEIQAELVRAREETERAGHGSYGFRLDVARNAVVIFRGSSDRRGSPDPAASDWERYGGAVEVRNEDLIGHDDACDWADACDPPLRGGIRIAVRRNGSCSSGFIVTPADPSFRYGLLTAGHCGQKGDNVVGYTARDGTMLIGPIVESVDDGPVDAAFVPVLDNAELLSYPGSGYWRPLGLIYHDVFRPHMAVRGKAFAGDSFPVGYLVCRTGYASGVVCGEIISQSGNPQAVRSFFNLPGTNYGMLETNLCSAGGDSGGPVYDWGYDANNVEQAIAIGVHSQSEVANVCADGEHSFHTHIADAERRLRVNVLCPNGCRYYY